MKREEELTVSVKPLEWKEIDLSVGNPPMVIWEAKTPFVNYTLESVMERPWFCHFICAHFADLDEAKAAAQSDYEARIRSTLLPEGWGHEKGIEAAIAAYEKSTGAEPYQTRGWIESAIEDAITAYRAALTAKPNPISDPLFGDVSEETIQIMDAHFSRSTPPK